MEVFGGLTLNRRPKEGVGSSSLSEGANSVRVSGLCRCKLIAS